MNDLTEKCFDNTKQKESFQYLLFITLAINVIFFIYGIVIIFIIEGGIIENVISTLILTIISLFLMIKVLKEMFSVGVKVKPCNTYDVAFEAKEPKYDLRTFFYSEQQKTYLFIVIIVYIVIAISISVVAFLHLIDETVSIYEQISSVILIIISVFILIFTIRNMIKSGTSPILNSKI